MQMRRIPAITLVLCLIIALLPIPAVAATVAQGTYGAVKWTLDSNGTLRIFGTGNMGTSGTNTTVNAAPWRDQADDITSVVIEEGVTTIGSGAFMYCPNLTKVTIPSTVEIIGDRAFYRCGKLVDLTIPSGVTTIKDQAFAQTGLTSVTLPQTITTVSAGMFYDCANLTDITFNGAITNIGESAFSSCDVLTNVTFKKGLAGEIGNSAFSYCPSITAFEIPKGVVRIMDNAFIGCTNLASITLPEGLESIWDSAFRETALVSVTIPQTVDYMGAHVFVFCNSLKNVTMHTSTVEGMTGILGDCDALEYVHIIGNAPQTDVKVFSNRHENFVVYYNEGTSGWVPPTWNGYLIEIWGQTDATKTGTCGENLTWMLKGNVLTISGTGSMINYSQEEAPWYLYRNRISHIVIEDGVTSIGDYAFAGMDNFTSATIAGSVVTIGKYSFFQCYGLTGITIPDGTVSLGSYAFCSCTGLTAITLADSVTTLGESIFSDCDQLENVRLSGRITEIPNGLFQNCRKLAGVNIPRGIKTIGASAFSGCFALHSLEIPDGVESIGTHALANNGLVDVTIPASVTTLQSGAFYDCKSLNYVRFLGDAPVFDGDVFQSVTTTCIYPAGNKTWTADVMQDYGGTITWSKPCTGDAHSYDQSVATERYLKSAATCTAAAVYYKSCTCGAKGEATFTSGTEKGHNMGQWTLVSEATPDADGQERRDCADCDHYETRSVAYGVNVLKLGSEDLLGQDTVWINGLPYAIQTIGTDRYVELPTDKDCLLVTYTYRIGSPDDIHTHYPTGMKVYKVSGGTIKHIPEFDDLLQYSGSSIRITGKKGIRMITSIAKDKKTALTGKGLAGYTLLEYGTALCWADDIGAGDALVLGTVYTRSNYAYKKGVADPVFATSGKLIQYTNVLVGFSNDQCKNDIAMRPYIILKDAKGQQITLYGGTIYRSVGYIAYQNRNAFKTGTTSYQYVWSIIHHVYGNKYDADYKK